MKNLIILTVFITTFYTLSIVTNSANIPRHLLVCYRNNVSMQLRALQVPLTSNVLVELVRNVEINLETVLNMRTMASSMFHSLKFDGIQRATNIPEEEHTIPVGPTSMHFNMFKLLNDYLLPGEGALFPMDTLTLEEMCTLHYVMSSSVQAWERGDEDKSCPKDISIINTEFSKPISKIRGRQISKCPIEKGVMRTPWGSVAPGKLLSGIVASLNPQDVKLIRLLQALQENEDIPILNMTRKPKNKDEEINNLWAATVAGDLAEVVVFQTPFVKNFIIGPMGAWNDSIISRNYYLPNTIGKHWEMTFAELLGAIDGALIGSKMKEWTEILSSLRMSQIIDMYYSRKGVAFDPSYQACKRREKFTELIKTIDLHAQTTYLAKLLTYRHIRYERDFIPMTDEQIEQASLNVVKSFQENLNQLTDINSDCEGGFQTPPMDILTVLDGTWTEYQARRLIGGLAHVADVSFYGSKMGFISGSSGAWLTNVTDKIFNLFEDLHRGETDKTLFWPTSFSLTKGLETVAKFMQNKTDKECMSTLRSTRTTVVLVLANTAIPNDRDLTTSQKLISTVKALQPGTPIIYVTSESNADTYIDLAKNIYMNDVVVKTEKKIKDVLQGVYGALTAIPRQIMELHCGISPLEYEDYITPDQDILYEIPYNFLQTTSNIKVEFVGYDYGEISICANDKETPENTICKGILEEESAEFEPEKICHADYACIVQFRAIVKSTKFKCAEDDCRYPDQTRIKIRTSWISSSLSLKPNAITTVLMLTYLFIYVAF